MWTQCGQLEEEQQTTTDDTPIYDSPTTTHLISSFLLEEEGQREAGQKKESSRRSPVRRWTVPSIACRTGTGEERRHVDTPHERPPSRRVLAALYIMAVIRIGRREHVHRPTR